MKGKCHTLSVFISNIHYLTERFERAEATQAAHTSTVAASANKNATSTSGLHGLRGSVLKPKGCAGGGKKGFHLQAAMRLDKIDKREKQYNMILVSSSCLPYLELLLTHLYQLQSSVHELAHTAYCSHSGLSLEDPTKIFLDGKSSSYWRVCIAHVCNRHVIFVPTLHGSKMTRLLLRFSNSICPVIVTTASVTGVLPVTSRLI
jgi:hypothetical protein